MLAFDLNMAFEGCPFDHLQGFYTEPNSWFGGVSFRWILLGGTLEFKWSVEIRNRSGRVQFRTYDTRQEAEQACESAEEEILAEEIAKEKAKAEEMAKEMNEMKAVFGRAFFGKNDGSISSFQMLRVLENLDGIVSCERLFGIDEAAKTIEQIFGDAHLAAVNQRFRNPGTCYLPSKDYEAYKEILEEVDEMIWTAHTMARMERESRGFVGGKRSGDTCTAESMKQIPWEFSYHRYRTGPESDHDAGIQNPTDISKIICEDSVRNPLLLDHAVQPGLAKTYAILFRNLLNVNLPICERWTDIGSTTFRPLRKVLKKVRSMKSRGPDIVSNGLSLFKSASKLAVGMVLFGNTPAVGAVGAMTPEAVEPGSLQAEDFEKSSNFAFGVVACVGTLVAIIALLKSFNWSRRHSIAGTSAASAPTGAILNRAVNMPETLTVVRLWRETEFREVVVARREEEGAYAS